MVRVTTADRNCDVSKKRMSVGRAREGALQAGEVLEMKARREELLGAIEVFTAGECRQQERSRRPMMKEGEESDLSRYLRLCRTIETEVQTSEMESGHERLRWVDNRSMPRYYAHHSPY
jgi:hypothetical protein